VLTNYLPRCFGNIAEYQDLLNNKYPRLSRRGVQRKSFVVEDSGLVQKENNKNEPKKNIKKALSQLLVLALVMSSHN
jgi:peroxiredoxin